MDYDNEETESADRAQRWAHWDVIFNLVALFLIAYFLDMKWLLAYGILTFVNAASGLRLQLMGIGFALRRVASAVGDRNSN